MAQTLVTDAGTITIPGAYPSIKVQNNPGGLATTGVLLLVGESDSGPRFSDEEDLSLNSFGPDQVQEFTAKYGSGPAVDAFRGAVSAANDPRIVGSFSRIIFAKTNSSVKATNILSKIGGGNYGVLSAKLAGASGSLISRVVTAAASEVVPTTGSFVLAPPHVATDVACRVNGGAEVSATIPAATLPPAAVVLIDAMTGVSASGGVDRTIITGVSGSLELVVDSGNQVHFLITGATFANTPSVGDILYCPVGSIFGANNEGTYVVTAATNARIDAYKVLDAAGTGAENTAPTAEGPTVIAAITDLQAFSPVVISVSAGTVVDGLGKSLEIGDSGAANFSVNAWTFSSATASPPISASTWVSKSGAAKVITSGTEYKVKINEARQSDSISEDIIAGGDVVLSLGYQGTTAQAVIASGVMTITVTGGAGTSPGPINLAAQETVSNLVSYLNSLTGFTAAAGSTALSQRNPTTLDEGTYTIASIHGANTGRIKDDGYQLEKAVDNDGVLINIDAISPATKLVGLPDVASLAFLSGGSKGATTDADILGGLDAFTSVQGNFVVPLFSQDASKDVSEGKTDSSSTYTIDSINANLRSHVLTMSQLKKKRNRQGFASHRGTFNESKAAASNQAASRVSMTFQDVRNTNSVGTLVQFHPWMGAVKAASMQAAGFYRAIVNKGVDVSGLIHADGSFSDQNDSNLEDALKSGLLPMKRDEDGNHVWVSDQTTWTRDDNFLRNSIQAVYAADVVALSTARRMEQAFLGESVADVSASLALSTLDGIMADMRRLKLIAASDDAPSGFKNVSIKLRPPSMYVSLEIKLATAIYFIPITFLVTPVTQSA